MSDQKINDGGPAFPSTEYKEPMGGGAHCVHRLNAGGMSLRDYFAGQALAGISGKLLDLHGTPALNKLSRAASVEPQDIIARMAVSLADATIAALTETAGGQ